MKKLEIETKKLMYEEKFFELSFWVKTLGGFFGGVAVIWTIVYGLRTISQRSKEQIQAKISSLLESLNSESEYTRLAAAGGLTQYIDDVVDGIIIAISTEKSQVVRNALENSLYQIKNNIKQVINYNCETLIYRSHLYGRLNQAGIEKKKIAARLRLTDRSLKTIKDRFNVDYEQGGKIQQMHMKRQEIIGSGQNGLDDGVAYLLKESEMVSRRAESTGRVIGRWIRDGREIHWPKTGLDLSETNLYKAELKKINIDCSVFSYCLMRHSNLEESTLPESDFSFADLFDTSMDNANFSGANLMNCHLRSSSGKFADFSKAYLKEAIFNQGDFSNANFSSATANKVQFRGTMLKNAVFDDCGLYQSEFQEADLEGASFNGANVFRSILIDANLKNSSMESVKLNGADLRGAKFLNAKLQDADFRGADIKNADFRGADIKNAKFENSKNFDEAIFDE